MWQILRLPHLSPQRHQTGVVNLPRKKRREENTEKIPVPKFEVNHDTDSTEPLECYVFNDTLDEVLDDGACEHCKYFLTMKCPHIDDFIDEVEEMELDI